MKKGVHGGNMVSPVLNDADPWQEQRYSF